MTSQAANPYLKTRIMTASPEQLRLMLYDGAIKFCRQARESLDHSQYEASYNSLMRAQKIVLELSTSLNHQIAPDLCERLSALYTFIYRRLVDANVNRDVTAIDESLKLLEFERQTWQMLMQQLGQQRSPAQSQMHLDHAQQTAISSLSVNG